LKYFRKTGHTLTYLITDGTLSDENFPEKSVHTLETLRLAMRVGISLIQMREKHLSAKNLFALAHDAAQIAQSSDTKLIINDRADIAVGSGAHGVQLTEASLKATVVRKYFSDLIIGVSTHSAESVVEAADAGADFALFGPVFESPGKENVQGLEKLRLACNAIPNFPVIAIGGIDQTNFPEVLEAGASGFASIRFLNNPENLRKIGDLHAGTAV
jgi:thiamine-phosphate pyrophosphorylase